MLLWLCDFYWVRNTLQCDQFLIFFNTPNICIVLSFSYIQYFFYTLISYVFILNARLINKSKIFHVFYQSHMYPCLRMSNILKSGLILNSYFFLLFFDMLIFINTSSVPLKQTSRKTIPFSTLNNLNLAFLNNNVDGISLFFFN